MTVQQPSAVSSQPSGRCRHCRCEEHSPCMLANGDTCGWIDASRTVCSNPACIRAEAARKRALKPAPRRGRNSSEIHALILQEDRARRARYRANAKAKGLIRGKGGKG